MLRLLERFELKQLADEASTAVLINRSGGALSTTLTGISVGRFADRFDVFLVDDDGLTESFRRLSDAESLVFELEADSVAYVVFRDAGIVGDDNGDGFVDAADYTVWRDTCGTLVEVGEGADGNQNGRIDGADYLVWAAAFGAGQAPTSASGVPEPSGLAVCLILAGVGARRQL